MYIHRGTAAAGRHRGKMEEETAASAAAAAVVRAPHPWCLDVAAHRVYMQQQLQRGLWLLSAADEAEGSGGLDALSALGFLDVQQQRSALISGVYWVLCCLALLQHQPAAAAAPGPLAAAAQAQQGKQEASLLELSPGLKETLLNKVVLPCLRRQHFARDTSASPAASRQRPAASALDAAAAAARADPAAAEAVTSVNSATAAAAAAAAGRTGAAPECCCTFVKGFSSSPAADAVAAALPTCSGLQALSLLGALGVLPEDTLKEMRRFLLFLQREEDGAFADRLPSCCCSGCWAQGTGAAAGGAWEQEGDVRCTFCCLLSLKLLQAAALAKRREAAASAAAAAVGAAATTTSPVDASAGASLATPTPARPLHVAASVVSAVAPAARAPSRPCVSADLAHVEGPPGVGAPIYDASWEAFLKDPFAGVRAEETVSWLLSLVSEDGGVGVSPGAEAHAGAAFCFAACLTLLGRREALGERRRRRLERCGLLLLFMLLLLVSLQQQMLLLEPILLLHCCCLVAASAANAVAVFRRVLLLQCLVVWQVLLALQVA